ncbi:MAG: SDR family oxidoreductase [Thermoguttaceae bacterium]|jgi:NAD(P)-dependent dehydrogenase (short-subunit alcohol dehydrogenase family)|nr:SDR family oxidoreductase [Thermoguttaceae bacterium]
MRFQDKVVLVTGASRNTGVGIAALFLREGARVCICGSTPDSTAQGGRLLREQGLDGFLETPADISDLAQVQTMFAKIRETYGRLDVLVNNACHQGIGPSFEEIDPEFFAAVVNTNLLGTFQVSREAVKMMLKQESRGVIVNLGSNVSTRAIRNRCAYVASKGGIDALTRAMAIDLAPKGIRVNMVAPGYIFTDRWETISEQTRARRRLNCPLGMEATADDVTEAVAFLASDASRNICGERLVVDAGCSAQHMPFDVDM